jgi:Zn-dependent protease with chaperone function
MVEGRYFFPRSTRFVAARATALAGRLLRIEAVDGTVLAEISAARIRVSARVGRLPRRLEFPNGDHFETTDNDGIDALRRELRFGDSARVLDRLERSWRWIAVAVVTAAALSYLFVAWGIPAIASYLASVTPPAVARVMSAQTLDIMDRAVLGPTVLSTAQQKHARAVFARVAIRAPLGTAGYHLLLRKGNAIGANAFALPDGSIVLTDELWTLARNDEEIEGVFGHEMSHVDHRHGLQEVYEVSMIPAAIAVITGDVSQVSQLATILPGVLVQSHYARDFEQQADDDAADRLIALGARPSRLADLLERLDAGHCGKPGCPSDWLGDHPDTATRAARLRARQR